MHRNERFSNEFMNKLENLFETFAYYIFNKFKEMSDETKELNQSVAYFLKVFLKKIIFLLQSRQTSTILDLLFE